MALTSPGTKPLPLFNVSQATRDAIAMCESRNDPYADNPHSSASGRYQFLDGTWEHYGKELWGNPGWKDRNVYSYDDNTELANYVFDNYGTKDWDASKHCWGNPQV